MTSLSLKYNELCVTYIQYTYVILLNFISELYLVDFSNFIYITVAMTSLSLKYNELCVTYIQYTYAILLNFLSELYLFDFSNFNMVNYRKNIVYLKKRIFF